ncbi:MAG: response regulator transcription factor [Bacteroidota bacterium]
MSEIRVLIVEDEVLIAEDIADSLSAIDYKVAGIAYSVKKALMLLESQHPDIVLLDIQLMGEQSGIDLAKIISEKHRIPFVFLTSFADKKTIDQAKKTMPYGYVVKPFSEKELFSSLEIAMYRFAMESRKKVPSRTQINQLAISDLTIKEYEILKDLCEGMTNKQLSESHFISVNTVKTHVRKILEKLDVRNRASVIHKIFG